jgi:hypothetical protein
MLLGLWAPSQAALLIVPALAAWIVRHRSLLVTLCLAQTAIYYGLTAVILGEDQSNVLVALVLAWTLGLTLGASCLKGRLGPMAPRHWSAPSWIQFALTLALIALQADLNLTGSAGYASQISGGLSTPTGFTGILTSAAPLVVITLVVSALGSQRRVRIWVLVGVLEAVALSLSGFRGAGVLFIIAIVIAAAITLPASSSWRRPRRASAALIILAILAVGGFFLGANVRNSAATQLSFSNQGTQLFGLGEAVPILANRLDLGQTLSLAIQVQKNAEVQEAVAWTSQVQAFVPRFLWSDKPVVDYGQLVSTIVFGNTTGLSSNSLTTIGDILVNFGIAGVALASVLLGFGLTFFERRIHHGVGLASLVVAAGLAYATKQWQDQPLILTLVALIRNLVVAWIILWLAGHALNLSAKVRPDRPYQARLRASAGET